MRKPVEILLVEDNAGDALLVQQALVTDTVRTNLHVATDGDQAARLLAAGRFIPDLVILDLNVPKMSGLSLLEHSRINAPIVVFTSSRSPADIRRAYELGAKDFVEKPTDLKQYSARVRYIVRRWGVSVNASRREVVATATAQA